MRDGVGAKQGVEWDAELAEELRQIPLFAELSDEQMGSVMRGAEMRPEPGEIIGEQGEPARGFFVQFEGNTEWTSLVDGQDIHYATFTPGTYFGHEVLLTDKLTPVTGRALEGVRLYKIDPDAFWVMLSVCPNILRTLVANLAERWQDLGDVSQQTAKLASLGTMSAGLAHELNNPASAARRAADGLEHTLRDLSTLALGLGEQDLDSDQKALLASVLDGAAGGGAEDVARDGDPGDSRATRTDPTSLTSLTSLERADLEDEAADRLDSFGVEEAWDLAPTFVEAGLAVERLEEIAGLLGPAAPTALAWLGTALVAQRSVGEVLQTTAQISDLVGAMKEYTYMDQSSLQEVDVHRGLENTLTILGHKLKRGVEVTRDYDPDLSPLWAYGSELNEVWTNLIDNAADSMGEAGGAGRLTIRTRRENDRVLVEIGDNGPGVPEELKGRVFEPFFTTKGVGEGTGLGLDVVRRIVVGRHRGDLRVISEPGDTRFQVRLPIDRPPLDQTPPQLQQPSADESSLGGV